MNMNSNKPMPLNLKSLRTRFALHFLRALKNINHQEKKKMITHHKKGGFKVAQIIRYRKVKVAAYASMAFAVGRRRAWTRAMLLRTRPGLNHCRTPPPVRRRRRRREARVEAEDEAEELKRLVPGGEAMDLQSLLDETAHYIKCLTTQVKVMRSIVNYCS